jgi:hypothetical protein
MEYPKVQVSIWKRELGKESKGLLKVANDLSNLPSVNTCLKQKENQVYDIICQTLDKQVNIVVPNCRKNQ